MFYEVDRLSIHTLQQLKPCQDILSPVDTDLQVLFMPLSCSSFRSLLTCNANHKDSRAHSSRRFNPMYRDIQSKESVLSVAREGFDLLTGMLLQITEPKNHCSETSIVSYCLAVDAGHCHLSSITEKLH